MLRNLKRGLILGAIGVSMLTMPVSAEVRNISATGTYTAGASESINTAKQKALQDAMRLATEQAGVLVSSYSKTNNMTLTADEVTTVASKIVKVTNEVYDVKLISDSSIQVTAKIDAQIDTDSIQADINRLKQENDTLKENVEQLKNENKEKEDVIHQIEDLKKYIFGKYSKGINPFKAKQNMPFGENISAEEYMNYFRIDMGYGDYSCALTDVIQTYKHKGHDELEIKRSVSICEANIMESSYRVAMRFAYLAKRSMKRYNIPINDKKLLTEIDLYYNVLNRYMNMYHPEWKTKIYVE